MATYTAAQVRNLALMHLGVLPAGETPSAADADLGDTAYRTVHAQLEDQNLVAWPSCDVPDAVALPLARLVAQELADSFGVSDAQAARIAAGAERAMTEIRRHSAVGWSDRDVTDALYY